MKGNSKDPTLWELIETMPIGRRELLLEMAGALVRTVQSTVDPKSDIATQQFNENFSSRLVLFHAMHEAALTKKTFEYLFCGASRAAGRTASLTANTVHPGEDVNVDGVNFSLKTESGASIKRNALTISKLMEARSLRECRSGEDFCRFARENVVGHLQHYQRLVSLRSFCLPKHVEYELVEVPRAVLDQIAYLKPEAFSARTTAGSSSAVVSDSKGNQLFNLVFDGAVEKVTVRNLDLAHCRRHATWKVEIA